MRWRCPAISPSRARWCAWARSSRWPRRASSMRRASCWRADAAPTTRRRRRLERSIRWGQAVTGFRNLGDLVVRDRDLSKVAVVDLGGETVPRAITYARLDAMAMEVARGLARRGLQR